MDWRPGSIFGMIVPLASCWNVIGGIASETAATVAAIEDWLSGSPELRRSDCCWSKVKGSESCMWCRVGSCICWTKGMKRINLWNVYTRSNAAEVVIIIKILLTNVLDELLLARDWAAAAAVNEKEMQDNDRHVKICKCGKIVVLPAATAPIPGWRLCFSLRWASIDSCSKVHLIVGD